MECLGGCGWCLFEKLRSEAEPYDGGAFALVRLLIELLSRGNGSSFAPVIKLSGEPILERMSRLQKERFHIHGLDTDREACVRDWALIWVPDKLHELT
jgi:hypothetical protein